MWSRKGKGRKVIVKSPLKGLLKFNVDGATKGKSSLQELQGFLAIIKGEVLYMFSENVKSQRLINAADVVAILEAIHIG